MVRPPNRALQHAEASVLRKGLMKPELVETQEVLSPDISTKLEIAMPQLYDVESSYSEPEKSLPLDLGLDQIEDCQE